MKKIKISFEYHCYPIWVYDENGFLLCNDLPEPLQNTKGLEELCQSLQSQFDSLYLDDGKVFEYVGFESEEQRNRFQEQVTVLQELLAREWGEAVYGDHMLSAFIRGSSNTEDSNDPRKYADY